MANILDDKLLEQVGGGLDRGLYYTENDVQLNHNVGEEITMVRSDFSRVFGTITNRGINKNGKGNFYACYYVDIHNYTGSGWLGDIGGIKFENRISGTPYRTGL